MEHRGVDRESRATHKWPQMLSRILVARDTGLHCSMNAVFIDNDSVVPLRRATRLFRNEGGPCPELTLVPLHSASFASIKVFMMALETFVLTQNRGPVP